MRWSWPRPACVVCSTRMRISTALPAETCVPAPGQGIIAIEIRDDDATDAGARGERFTTRDRRGADAERAVVTRLGGGCQMPIGAVRRRSRARRCTLAAIVIALDGSREVRASAAGSVREPSAVGIARRRCAAGARCGYDSRRRPTRAERNERATMKNPAVYLIGTGPGDPGLITVHGLDCLRNADVVIHDHLVPRAAVEARAARRRADRRRQRGAPADGAGGDQPARRRESARRQAGGAV